MSKGNFFPVLRTVFLLAVVIGGIVFVFALGYDLQNNAALWPAARSTSIVWVVCTIVLFLTAISFLRLTKASWFWSMLGGVLIIVIYSVIVTLLFDLLEGFMRGWLFG
jgi:uncharacterized membrane protein SirB2